MAKKKVFQISNALAEGLEETVTAAHSYHGELRIEAIALKKIELDPDNPRDLALSFNDIQLGIMEADPLYARKLQEREALQTLANSILAQGIINPILVYKHDDKYRLIAGERRTLASLLAGKSDIQAKILDAKPTALKISLLQWIENIERKDLSLAERLNNLSKIMEADAKQQTKDSKQYTATDLSRLLGCSLSHAMNYIAVLHADGVLKQLIENQKIKNLEKAALLSSIRVEPLRQAAIEACLSGMPLKKLKVIAAQERLSKPKAVNHTARHRGRQASSVDLGTTKHRKIVRLLIDTLLSQQRYQHLKPSFTDINWEDYKSVSDNFKQLLKSLETMEG